MKDRFLKRILATLTALCLLCGGGGALAEEGESAAAATPLAVEQTEVENVQPEPKQAAVPPVEAPPAETPHAATAAPVEVTAAPVSAAPAPVEDAPAPVEERHEDVGTPASAPVEERHEDVGTPAPAPVENTAAPTEAVRTAAPSSVPEKPAEVFIAGYAAVASKSVFYWEDGTERTLDGKAVVYAFEYDEREARVRVAFNEDAQIQKAWVEADRLRMLDAEAVADYLKGDPEGVLRWEDVLLWPLSFVPEVEPTEVENNETPAPAATAPASDESDMNPGAADMPPAPVEEEATVAPDESAEPTNEATAAPGGGPSEGAPEVESTPEVENTPEAENAPGAENTPEVENTPEAENTPEVENTPAAEATVSPEPTMEIALDVPRATEEPDEQVDAAPRMMAVRAISIPMEIDYLAEQLRFDSPVAGTLRFYRAGADALVYEQQIAEPCAIDLKLLDGAPGAAEMAFRVEFAAEGAAPETAELRIPARPEHVPEASLPLMDASYTAATITGDGSCAYALSLPDETEPSLFEENGAFTGLAGGTAYTVWSRNPAEQDCFASAWTKLEGAACTTLAQTPATACFDGGAMELRAQWRPGMAEFDPATGIFFQSEGASIDAEVAGNFSAVWKNALGEVLEAAPVDAGEYTLELRLTGAAERYGLSGAPLSYIVEPLDLGAEEIAVLTGAPCVYNGAAQLPSGVRVLLGEVELPADCYVLKERADANCVDAGEACALIVGESANVTGQRAFAYRIEPRPVTVLPERPQDMCYNGGVEVPLTLSGWALDGVLEGDALTLDVSGARAAMDTPDAGTGKAVRIEGVALAGADAANYTIDSIAPCAVNVLKAAAPEIAWPSAGGITYGQRLSEAALTGGSTQLGSFSWAAPDSRPGAGEGSFEMRFSPADSVNYAWAEENLRRAIGLKVSPRAAAVYAGSFEKAAGQPDPSFTASTEGVLKGDTLSYSLSRAPGEAKGSYAISVNLGKNPNYSVKTREGTLTIVGRSVNAASVTVSEIPRQVYTGSEIRPKPLVRDGNTVLRENVDYTLAYHGNRLEGVGTIDITGIGGYSGTRTVSFTIYKLSSTGGFVNSSDVEGEESGFHGFDGAEDDLDESWESGEYNFLPQSEMLNNPLYDEYLGTGEGLEELDVVTDGMGMAQAYELLPIYPVADAEEEFAPDATLLIYAGPDASGEAAERVLSLSGMQLARLNVERGMGTLLFRNCETTLVLDVYEMVSGDAAKLAKLLYSGEADAQTQIESLDLGGMEEASLTLEELSALRYEMRAGAVTLDGGEPGCDLSVWLCCEGVELEVSSLLPMLMVGANVEGMYEEGYEDDFVVQFANALVDGVGEAVALEGALECLPDVTPEAQEAGAVRYVAEHGEVDGEIAVRAEDNTDLGLYACQTLVSPWAGPGVYLLLDTLAE